MTPFLHQAKSIQHLLSILPKQRGVVDASDMGTGKTLVGVEIVKATDLPTLVVCPKSVRAGWLRTGQAQGVEFDVINYEMLRTGRTPYGSWKVPPGCRKPRFYYADAVRLVLLDESQRCMGMNTANSDLMRAVRRQGLYGLAMSGTIADSPLEMDALGYFLQLHDSNSPPTVKTPEPVDFYTWARRNGCGPGLWSHLEFHGNAEQQLKRMEKLYRQIFPSKGVRVRTTEIPDFPSIQIRAELYEISDPKKFNRLYAEMAGEIAALHKHDAEMKAELLHKAKENGFEGDALPDDPLVENIRARQEMELLKVPVFVELTLDAISEGRSVAIFVNFQQSLRAICTKLKTDCTIDGTQIGAQGAIRRETNRMAFQADHERAIVCISEAAGLGLDMHDVTGRHPRLALVSPGFNAKLLRQIFWRICRAGGKSASLVRLIFAADTVEEPIQKAVARKLDRLDALQDGDLMPKNLKFVDK